MRFRFLVEPPADGAHNMALDEVLFRSALESSTAATVRLYGFDRPTVSYGHRQRLDEAVDPEACRALGVGWVRRPTGGRALLHQHELTYSVAAPALGPFHGLSVRGVYDRVSEALRRALVDLSVPLDPPAPLRAERSPEPALPVPCLAVTSRHEITSGGRKLVASAQRRSSKGFLQHGSILFRVDARLWGRIAPRSPAVLEAAGIEDWTGRPAPLGQLVEALRKSFEALFEGEAVPSGLTASELELLRSTLPRYRPERALPSASPRLPRPGALQIG